MCRSRGRAGPVPGGNGGGAIGAARRAGNAVAHPRSAFHDVFTTRDFGYLVFDTLFAVDDKFEPKPQMVER
jgi:hypothetical protein